MKKLYVIALWLLLISFVLSSCDNSELMQTENTDEQTTLGEDIWSESTETTANTDDETSGTEETSDNVSETTYYTVSPIDHDFEEIASYPKMNSMTESARFVLFDYRGTVCYYDKESGEANQYCFDPDCTHTNWQECISLQFLMMDKNQSVVYSAYDHRFYALRGEKLCSFSHEGEDVRIEYSFGASGDFDEFLYNIFNVYDLQASGQYLFMIACDQNTGKKNLYRYDIEKDEMRLLSGELEGNIEKYLVYDDKIHYIYDDGKHQYPHYCFSTLEMTRIYDWGGLGNMYLKSIVRNNKGYSLIATDFGSYYIEVKDFITRRREILKEFYEKIDLLAVDDEYIYYSIERKYPSHTELYAYHIRTGMTVKILDGEGDFYRNFILENLRFLEDKKVIFTGTFGGVPALYTAEINKDGVFKRIKRILD